ncbi:MAG: hypothetical protein GX992_02890 [Clostridium sp.]|nr:hypothetical protein [Clostridium sp.]
MLQIFIEISVCVLAAYGFITLIHETALFVKQNRKYKNCMIKLVLVVKNQGETIEGVLRSVLPRDFIRKLMPGGKLTILDMDSVDDTMDILKRLERDYECLEILKGSEKDLLFRYFDVKNGEESGAECSGKNT